MTFYSFLRKVSGLYLIHRRIVSLLGDVPMNSSILDVGCGKGAILSDLYSKFGNNLNYIGIDPDQTKLDIARKHLNSRIILKRAYANALPVVRDTQDRVICSLTFHHIPHESRIASLVEMIKVLKPGGKLIITEFGQPNGVGWFFNLFNTCRTISLGIVPWLLDQIHLNGASVEVVKHQFGFIEHIVVTKWKETRHI